MKVREIIFSPSQIYSRMRQGRTETKLIVYRHENAKATGGVFPVVIGYKSDMNINEQRLKLENHDMTVGLILALIEALPKERANSLLYSIGKADRRAKDRRKS